MMRSARIPCPANCGRARQRWQAVCPACWRRLPVDLREPLLSARRAKARHLEAKASMAATAWLRAHDPAALAARVAGA